MSFNNQNSGSGGVRNLRVMFENRGTDISESPPSRGRSPATSDASLPSRPVSKVRASFVAVERPSEAGQGQQWGLRKLSDVSSMAELQHEVTNGIVKPESQDGIFTPQKPKSETPGESVTTPHPVSTGENNTTASADSTSVEKSEVAVADTENGGLGSILKGSPFELSSPGEDFSTSASPLDDKTSLKLPKKASSTTNSMQEARTKPKPIMLPDSIKDSVDPDGTQPPPSVKLNTTKEARPVKPPPTRQARPSPSVKSPTTPKTPVSPKLQKPTTRASAAKHNAVTESSARSPGSAKGSPVLPKESTRGSLTSAKSNPTETSNAQGPLLSPKTNGASEEAKSTPPRGKPRPRSPTRPVRLPAAATATTAASAARTSAETNGPSSRANITSTLQKKPSGLKRDRPSSKIATLTTASSSAKRSQVTSLPSQANGHEKPKARVASTAKAPNESFLTRMTRPTASSAQKAHEKLLANSPPRGRRHVSVPKERGRKSTGKDSEDKENKPEFEAESAGKSPAENEQSGLPHEPREPLAELKREDERATAEEAEP